MKGYYQKHLRELLCESGLNSSGSEHSPIACSHENSNEPSGYISGGESVEQMSHQQFIKTHSTLCT
jgi:hypothetical protein